MDPDRLIVTDLDGTLVGDAAATERFASWFDENRGSWRLVFASGRRLDSVRDLISSEGLPRPDAIISGVGTEIHTGDGRPWPGWSDRFGGWQADRVRTILSSFSWLTPQPAVNQTH